MMFVILPVCRCGRPLDEHDVIGSLPVKGSATVDLDIDTCVNYVYSHKQFFWRE